MLFDTICIINFHILLINLFCLFFIGDDFDIKDFHSVVLENGPMPLKTLEKLVNHWIDEVKLESESRRNKGCQVNLN